MWDYDDVVYYNRLLKEGYRDDAVIMDEPDEDYDYDYDTNMDDWESDDYI